MRRIGDFLDKNILLVLLVNITLLLILIVMVSVMHESTENPDINWLKLYSVRIALYSFSLFLGLVLYFKANSWKMLSTSLRKLLKDLGIEVVGAILVILILNTEPAISAFFSDALNTNK